MKDNLSPRQIEAIKALIQYPTVKEAAEASGIPIRTLERWLTQPEFLEVLHQVQKDSFQEAGRKIISSMAEAAEAITDIMRNPTQPAANIKLRAANVALELGTKYYKELELIGRVKKLEEKAGFADNTRMAQLEDYYCKRIVDNYMQTPAYQSLAYIDEFELDYLDCAIEHDPNLINLLSFEERMKYDFAFAKRQRFDELMKKKGVLLRAEIEKKRYEEKRKKVTKQRTKQVKPPDPSDASANESNPTPPDDIVEEVTGKTQSDDSDDRPSIITDEAFKESGLDRINRKMKERDENEEQFNSDEDDENKQYWEPEEEN